MFTWLIKDFKSLQDRRIQSQEFDAGGCRWCLLVYPNGKEGRNSVSLYLLVVGYKDLPPGWKITAKFSLRIVNNFSESLSEQGTEETWFNRDYPACGRNNWLHRSKLNNGFLVNGDLKIVAEVEVLHKSGVETHEEMEDLDYQL
ncbi:unnamed protein product [Arabis nemorensis]|uniref:MATH domain-containing protein n=1 Tax=Arabis nemorensis TaxID=586526 RepID=A0A565BQP8_9BRAS|nr:unnamed protein product [Arabis nemorensis]